MRGFSIDIWLVDEITLKQPSLRMLQLLPKLINDTL